MRNRISRQTEVGTRRWPDVPNYLSLRILQSAACITFLNMLPLVFFSLNAQNVGESCEAQWVCVDQRTALYKKYPLLLLLYLLFLEHVYSRVFPLVFISLWFQAFCTSWLRVLPWRSQWWDRFGSPVDIRAISRKWWRLKPLPPPRTWRNQVKTSPSFRHRLHNSSCSALFA